MKNRLLKVSAALLSLLIIVTTLCSCISPLVPGERADWEDETHEAVLYNEKRYVLCREKDAFSWFRKAEFDLFTGFVRGDEPTGFNASKDKKVLCISDGKQYTIEYDGGAFISYDKYYVLEDEYETIAAEYEKVFEDAEYFCFYDMKTSLINDNYIMFSDEMIDGLKAATEENHVVSDDMPEFWTEHCYTYDVKICNSDMTVVFDFGYLNYVVTDNKLHIYLDRPDKPYSTGTIEIPEKYKKTFALFLKDSISKK